MELENLITDVKSSPIFNMSLSSKELFHSNFIAWLIETYPIKMWKIFADYTNLINQKEDFVIRMETIEREKENIDLMFNVSKVNDESIVHKIIIENKVKSLPYISQLHEYSKKMSEENNQNNLNKKNINKIQSLHFILLSLSEPKHLYEDLENKIINDGANVWEFFSYEKLIEGLEEQLDFQLRKEDENDKIQYHKSLVRDYSNLVRFLIKINESTNFDENENFNYNLKADQLRNIRMHDFYLKKKYEYIAYELYLKLLKYANEIKESAEIRQFGERITWESTKREISISSGMTNSAGLIDVKFKIFQGLSLGIQIQENNYRLVIEDMDGKIALKISEHLDAKNIWFVFNEGENVYPFENKNLEKPKKFNKFNNNRGDTSFIYKSVKLEKIKVIDLLNRVMGDIDKISKIEIYKQEKDSDYHLKYINSTMIEINEIINI